MADPTVPGVVRLAIACNLVATVGIVALTYHARGPFTAEYFPPDASHRAAPVPPARRDIEPHPPLRAGIRSAPPAYGASDPAMPPWTIMPNGTVRMVDEGR